MKTAVISLTEKGRLLSKTIAEDLDENHTAERFCFHLHTDENAQDFSDIYTLAAELFNTYNALVFVCASGIAVRAIAPHIKSKTSDPAVIVIDDCGKFVIPILSGHLGGANQLAQIIAAKICAVPVITTATDACGRFSPDSFAKANRLIITDMAAAKQIAAAVLDGEMTGLLSEYPCENIPSELCTDKACRTGIYIGTDSDKKPFETTLFLAPKNIIVGIGCKKGITYEAIEAHIKECFKAAKISAVRLCAAATIDIKSNENGLLEFCRKHNIRLLTYSAKELMNVTGSFSSSDFVLKTTGTDNVCERSTAAAGGKLILHKTAGNGVTAAIAELPVHIDFERKIML